MSALVQGIPEVPVPVLVGEQVQVLVGMVKGKGEEESGRTPQEGMKWLPTAKERLVIVTAGLMGSPARSTSKEEAEKEKEIELTGLDR